MSEAIHAEMDALVRVARAAIGPKADGAFPNIGKLDRVLFQRLANWHKLRPLVARVLADCDPDEEARRAWRDVLRQVAAEAERKFVQQREVCSAFEKAEIPVLPLRGLLLSRALYGEAYLRAPEDIDLLVPASDAVRAMDMLVERGFKPPVPLSPLQREACAHFRGECAFLDEAGRSAVDLHWRAMPSCFELVPDAALWSRAGRAEWDGHVFREVCPAHQLLLLCSHGAKHGWDRLVYLVDFAAAWQRYPREAVLEAHRVAEGSPRARLWRFGVLLAREVLRVDPPPELMENLEEDVLRPFVTQAKRRLLDVAMVGAPGGREREWIRVWLPDLRDRRAYWRELVWAPSLIELSAVRLPRRLWAGYWGLRWARLAWRAITRAASRR